MNVYGKSASCTKHLDLFSRVFFGKISSLSCFRNFYRNFKMISPIVVIVCVSVLGFQLLSFLLTFRINNPSLQCEKLKCFPLLNLLQCICFSASQLFCSKREIEVDFEHETRIQHTNYYCVINGFQHIGLHVNQRCVHLMIFNWGGFQSCSFQ